jgi:hypothetical protein
MDKEKKIIEISKQILKDFEREYFDNTFKVFRPIDVKKRTYYIFSYDVWEIFINVPDEQFGGTGVFSMYFKDETMEPFMFHDGGAEGRTPDLEILMKDGKYLIGDVWENK